MTTTAEPKLKEGRVVAIAGPVIDVEFPPDALPEINNALEVDIELEGEKITVTAEVAQQIGDSRVRAICMKPTDGLTRGRTVRNLGRGITVPVGRRRPRPRVERDRRAARRPASELTEVSTTAGRSTASRPRSTRSSRARDVRDRHQGDRPARALRAGRQDRPVRRRGRGQDHPHPWR